MSERLPYAVLCPKGCKEYRSYHHDYYYSLSPIYGKEPKDRTSKMMVVKCPKCKFEAFVKKEYQERYGKPTDPYWDGKRVVIPGMKKMSEALYNKMLERWIDFLSGKMALEEPMNEDHLWDLYDDLSHSFCEEYGYSERTEEFVFHGQWYDTFVDEYCKKLKDKGWEGFDEREKAFYS